MDTEFNNDLPWKAPVEMYRFERNHCAFKQVVGGADEFNDSIGKISLNFSYLQEVVSSCIIKLIKTNKKLGMIIVSELSFKNKLNLLGSMFQYYTPTYEFNSLFDNQNETFDELLKACFKCEEFRNQILHSSFDHTNKDIVRKKPPPKRNRA